ncbi:MAG: hypothetical protein HY908_02125 [Myxococcales bacterium]|nr:hypothetical protein [Myxococcales bacterium]
MDQNTETNVDHERACGHLTEAVARGGTISRASYEAALHATDLAAEPVRRESANVARDLRALLGEIEAAPIADELREPMRAHVVAHLDGLDAAKDVAELESASQHGLRLLRALSESDTLARAITFKLEQAGWATDARKANAEEEATAQANRTSLAPSFDARPPRPRPSRTIRDAIVFWPLSEVRELAAYTARRAAANERAAASAGLHKPSLAPAPEVLLAVFAMRRDRVMRRVAAAEAAERQGAGARP